ncbi:MAG: hypothetical protein WA705_25225, partial [Candidatus Ozemobacteraceae bacterium]
MIIENGVPCHRKVTYRGLCEMHIARLKVIGRFDEFAQRPKDRRHRFEVKPNPEPGICRLIVNGVPCTLPACRKGMCDRHYTSIWQRPDLKIDDFAPPLGMITHSYKRQRYPERGRCVVQEVINVPAKGTSIIKCKEGTHARGLCKSHYRKLSENSALFDELADPVRGKVQYELKKDPKPGQCVIIQDGIGCTRLAGQKRRVCRLHSSTLQKAELLEKLTDQFVPGETVYVKKPDSDCVDGFCRMIVNGIPCQKPPKRRGLCSSCLNLVEKFKDDFEKYALPPRVRKESKIKRKRKPIKGLCLVIENDVPCMHVSHARGICQHHYKILTGRQKLQHFALTEEELASLPDIPHWYLDKNVVIDFVMNEVFLDSGRPDAVAIVKEVLDQKILATISLDCIRAVYSKLSHRLAREPGEGKGLSPIEAEAEGRAYTGKLFHKRGGLWHILSHDRHHHELCTVGGKFSDLTLEDALEVCLFGIAQSEHGAELFVTSDKWL